MLTNITTLNYFKKYGFMEFICYSLPLVQDSLVIRSLYFCGRKDLRIMFQVNTEDKKFQFGQVIETEVDLEQLDF